MPGLADPPFIKRYTEPMRSARLQRRDAGLFLAALVLMGGGKDVDAAFRWLTAKAGGGHVVVVRASGTDAYNPYILKLGARSVETLIIKTPEEARDPQTLDKIRHADALWIAGGDQWNYVGTWRPSPVRDALQFLIDHNVPFGGTSAGLAVLGQYSFTAEKDSVTSAQALADPYHERVAIGADFLRIPILKGIITDSHFVTRDRMGRLLVFLSRILVEHEGSDARAIAIDERTAALIEGSGTVSIEGAGPVFFLRAATKPEVCRPGVPLTVRGISVYRAKAGAAFDLKTWTGTGGTAYELSVENGVVRSTQPGGSAY
jgi:cyanophycinase